MCEPDKRLDSTGDAPKVIETNKKAIVVKKKHVDYSKYQDHMECQWRRSKFRAASQCAMDAMARNKTLPYDQVPRPANNVNGCNEAIASDAVKAQAPAVDDCSNVARLYVYW